jgi:acyl carrier protein
MTLTMQSARDLVGASLLRIVPDADLAALPDDAPFRDELELDSLDFLSFVELLSTGSGRRIDEDDYPRLRTMADCVTFLST